MYATARYLMLRVLMRVLLGLHYGSLSDLKPMFSRKWMR